MTALQCARSRAIHVIVVTTQFDTFPGSVVVKEPRLIGRMGPADAANHLKAESFHNVGEARDLVN